LYSTNPQCKQHSYSLRVVRGMSNTTEPSHLIFEPIFFNFFENIFELIFAAKQNVRWRATSNTSRLQSDVRLTVTEGRRQLVTPPASRIGRWKKGGRRAAPRGERVTIQRRRSYLTAEGPTTFLLAASTTGRKGGKEKKRKWRPATRRRSEERSNGDRLR